MSGKSPTSPRLPATVVACALTIAATATGAAELAPGVHLFRGTFVEGRQPDGNSVVFIAPDGLVVVDTGRHPAHTQQLLDLAAARGEPVVAIVNTHWHLDHIGGNARVREQHPNAKILATSALAGARDGFLAGYRTQLESLIASPDRAASEKDQFRAELGLIAGSAALEPDVVVGEGEAARLVAGRPLELHRAQGATDGDLWVFDPATGILVAGDLVTLPAPLFDTACPRQWQVALQGLAKTEFRTLVPGHGPPLDRAGFDRYRLAFDHLLTCAGSQRPGEECIAGWLADAGTLVEPGDEKLARGLLGYYVDVLRDPARQAC